MACSFRKHVCSFSSLGVAGDQRRRIRDLKAALDVVAVAAGSTLSDASDLNNLSEKLKQLDREAAAVLSASSGLLGAKWNGKFLAYEGPYEALPRIADRNFYETSKGSSFRMPEEAGRANEYSSPTWK
jgi:hypothetical protein